MSANRWSWVAVAVVVLVVGFLVVRTLQRDTATRVEPTVTETRRDPQAGPDTAAVRVADHTSSVERAKLVLKARGYYEGPIDGNYDPVLANALKRFQQDSGMKPTGYLDPKTYAALGVEVRRKRK